MGEWESRCVYNVDRSTGQWTWLSAATLCSCTQTSSHSCSSWNAVFGCWRNSFMDWSKVHFISDVWSSDVWLWPPRIADAILYFCPVVSYSIFLIFFLASSQPSQIGCLPYFYTWCGLSVNLGCRSATCCKRLAGNAGRKNDAKNRHLGTILQLCRAESSQQRHVSTFRKKLVQQQYMSPQCGELRPTSGWDRFTSLGHPS